MNSPLKGFVVNQSLVQISDEAYAKALKFFEEELYSESLEVLFEALGDPFSLNNDNFPSIDTINLLGWNFLSLRDYSSLT